MELLKKRLIAPVVSITTTNKWSFGTLIAHILFPIAFVSYKKNLVV